MQKLQWDFDGFSELASAKFDSKLLFKRKKIITKKRTCRFAFSFLLYFRYIPRKVLFKSECVMGIGPILIEIVLDFRKYLF
jgi:hypothetical protein